MQAINVKRHIWNSLLHLGALILSSSNSGCSFAYYKRTILSCKDLEVNTHTHTHTAAISFTITQNSIEIICNVHIFRNYTAAAPFSVKNIVYRFSLFSHQVFLQSSFYTKIHLWNMRHIIFCKSFQNLQVFSLFSASKCKTYLIMFNTFPLIQNKVFPFQSICFFIDGFSVLFFFCALSLSFSFFIANVQISDHQPIPIHKQTQKMVLPTKPENCSTMRTQNTSHERYQERYDHITNKLWI